MNQGFHLFKEGDPGNFFYIVKEGELELTLNSQEIKHLGKGESFGELALLQKNLRSSTVKSLTDVKVYCLEGNLFKEILLKLNNQNLKERIYFLSLNPIFKFLEPNQLHDIARNMLKCEFNCGEKIEENEMGESLYIIKEGLINYYENNILIRKLQPKDFFGISCFLFNEKKSYNTISETYSKCFQITKNLMIEILGTNFLDIILQGICKEALSRIKKIKILALEEYFFKLFPLLKLKIYNNSDLIFAKDNHENKKIIILIEGSIKNVNNIFFN